MQALPIDPHIHRILVEIEKQRSVVLTAAPGAGKTTRLPPQLLNLVQGRVIVLQPRRMAAIAACRRICEEQGWEVGRQAGYQVRFESRISSETRLIFMTDALLLRQMIDDSELSGVDLLVLDEFHERNLNQDLILGSVREMQELGREIRLLVMSATLDLPRLKKFLEPCGEYDVPGLTFPLETRHSKEPLSQRTDHDFFDRVRGACLNAANETDGDVLVFLPGVGEIQRVQDRLVDAGLRNREILPLHGSLSLTEQQAVLTPATQKRIILATNVAEASVTVPGVDFVIDTGLAKVMETNFKTGFSRLNLERISLFNAKQRSGRAARQKPGIALRLWTAFEEQTQTLEPVPEVRRVDLAQALLFLAHLGVSDFNRFSWFDDPSGPLLMQALRFLKSVGALDSSHRISELGRRLLSYPLPPRWGSIVALGENRGQGGVATSVAALLSEKDIVDCGRHTEVRDLSECDVSYRLGLLQERGRNEANRRSVENVLQVRDQLRRLIKSSGESLSVATLLLLSQPDRVCRRRKGTNRALMVGGRGVKLSEQSQVRESEFFVALQGVDLPGQNETLIGMACGFEKDLLLKELADRIETRSDVYYDEDKDQFYSRKGRFFFDLPIDEPVLGSVRAEDVSQDMVEVALERWPLVVKGNESLSRWLERMRFLHQRDTSFPVDLSESEKRQILELACYGKTRLQELAGQDLKPFLDQVLSSDIVRTVEQETPSHFVAPTGSRLLIHYGESHSAYVEVRLQEMFGVPSSPRLAFGQVSLTFRLLAPNYRPVQVTSDLSSFWKNGYPEVRKELRTRYPKHSWPDDPMSAKPEAKGRRQR